jgi:hypothetical protein
MRKNFLIPSQMIALSAIILMLWSCTKEKVSDPAAQQSSSSLTSDEALQAGEISVDAVVPGTYTIVKFIDTGDDHTADFNGYTFDFQADGTFVAHTNTGGVFTGSWKLNQAQTRMTITISGNNKLKNLDDDNWRVAKITNQRISLKKPGPDAVVFKMQ